MSNKYPKINYIGNKEKIADWIIDCLPSNTKTVVDLFCGGCSVSHALKKRGYTVIANDVLYANYVLAKALIENNGETLLEADFDLELTATETEVARSRVRFLGNLLYFPQETEELARLVGISDRLTGYKKYLFLSLLRRAMIRKIPYSRMNIKWTEIVKLRDEAYSYEKYGRYRHYHNVSFFEHIKDNLKEYNEAVVCGDAMCTAANEDACVFLDNLRDRVDVIYMDPPYPSTMNDYDSFYGAFDEIFSERKRTHLDLTDKKTFLDAFYRLVESCRGKTDYVAISLNNKCYPSQELLLKTLAPLLENYRVLERDHVYKVTGKENKNTNYEILILCRLKERENG